MVIHAREAETIYTQQARQDQLASMGLELANQACLMLGRIGVDCRFPRGAARGHSPISERATHRMPNKVQDRSGQQIIRGR